MEKIETEANLLKALAHPTRLRIIKHLINNGCNVTNIVEFLGVPQATISQHLTILKANGIIKGKRNGSVICYDVVSQQVRDIVSALK